MSMETTHTPNWRRDGSQFTGDRHTVYLVEGDDGQYPTLFIESRYATKKEAAQFERRVALVLDGLNNYARLKANADALEAALRAIVKAERDFWKEAGVRSEMDDPLNEVIKEARAVLKTISKERKP